MDGQGEGKRTALTYLALHPNLSSSVRWSSHSFAHTTAVSRTN